MTVICGGGTSEAKPGFSEFVVVSTASFTALFNNVPIKWAALAAGVLAAATYNLGELCTTDPPDEPEFTLADYLALFNPLDLNAPAAYNKLQQLATRYLWYTFCQCSTVSTPAPPAPPLLPDDFPTVYDQPGPALNCGYEIGGPAEVVPTLRTGLIGHQATPLLVFPIPTGALRVLLSASVSGAPSTPDDVEIRISFWTAANTFVSGGFFDTDLAGGESGEQSFPIPASATQYFVDCSMSGTVGHGWFVSARADFFCTAPGATQSPCCPPDPVLAGLLSQIYALLIRTRTEVELIQRQSAPFGYVAGTVYEDLSGAGEIPIADLIGARIVITATMAGTIGEEVGNPTHLFGAGWFQWGTADGYGPRIWLDQAETLSLPAAAGAYTLLAYSLPPGLVVDVVELVREP